LFIPDHGSGIHFYARWMQQKKGTHGHTNEMKPAYYYIDMWPGFLTLHIFSLTFLTAVLSTVQKLNNCSSHSPAVLYAQHGPIFPNLLLRQK